MKSGGKEDGTLALYETVIEPAWIDYNGHMNVAYYVLVFDRATDALLDRLGVGAAYRAAENRTIYVLEAHVTYERELKAGDAVRVTTQLIGADEKRIHFFHRMFHARDGFLAATTELLALHVDLAGPRAAPLPERSRQALADILATHRDLPSPPQLGRVIGLKKPG